MLCRIMVSESSESRSPLDCLTLKYEENEMLLNTENHLHNITVSSKEALIFWKLGLLFYSVCWHNFILKMLRTTNLNCEVSYKLT
jgi:hypothetical protein